MIYTYGLDRSTNHIMVYDGNTPIEVVKLYFWYNPDPVNGDDYDEIGWVTMVGHILQRYGIKYNIPIENLSAKPIKILHALDLVL